MLKQLLTGLLCIQLSFGALAAPAPMGETPLPPTNKSSDGETLVGTQYIKGQSGILTFNIYESYTPILSERQVRYELEESRTLLSNTHITVLIGRDLDQDGKIDVWFPLSSSGAASAIDGVAQRRDGWDGALGVLQQLGIQDRSLLSIIIDHIPSLAIFTNYKLKNFKQTLFERQMGVLGLEKRVLRLAAAKKLTPMEQLPYYEAISAEWNAIADFITTDGIHGFWKGIAIDAAFAAIAELAIRGVAAGASFLGPRIAKTAEATMMPLMRTPVGKAVQRQFVTYSERIAFVRAQAAARLLEIRGVARVTAGFSLAKLATMATYQRIMVYNQAIIAKEVMVALTKAWWSQKDYVALNFAIQLAVEADGHWDEIKDPNPFKMANNIWKNKDMRQNLSFMLAETSLQTSIHSVFGLNGRSVVICGFLSFADSVSNDLWVKKESDPGRIAGDTVWESTYGNAQTLADLRMRKYLEMRAMQTGSSKFKLLGFVWVLANQGSGYYFYNKGTDYYETKMKQKALKPPKLEDFFAPILQSHSNETNSTEKDIILFPVLVPAGT